MWRIFACFVGVAACWGADEGKQRMVFQPGASEPLPEATPTPAPPRGDPEGVVEVFFLTLRAGKVEAAYDQLVRGTLIAERKDDVASLKKRTTDALDTYGPLRGFETLDKQTAGDHLVRLTCLSLNADLPLRWKFYFYKSASGWRLVDLRIDDALVDLFEEPPRRRSP